MGNALGVNETNLQGQKGKKINKYSLSKYQPSGEGGTRSPPAAPHRLQNPIWPPGGPKMADGVWKGGHSKQLSLNKWEKTDDYSGHYVIASRRPPECRPLERRTLVPK